MRQYLKTYVKKKKTINLIQLEQVWPSGEGREGFIEALELLQTEGVLEPVKSAGVSPQGLPQRFRIHRKILESQKRSNIRELNLGLHPDISLMNYYRLTESDLEKDLPHILKVDEALRLTGLPHHPMTIPELSLWLMGDEKWLTEKGGRELLVRLGIWLTLEPLVTKHPEPLMMAVNLKQVPRGNDLLKVLVVENKSTYYALLKDTSWHCLVYGAGWKIRGNMRMLPQQLNLPEEKLLVNYFGDLDPEGIRIWRTLFESNPFQVVPAVGLYKKLLKNQWRRGKEKQRLDEVTRRAITSFAGYFSGEVAEELEKQLNERKYIPQEALDTTSTTT